ncbi:hypothetical protein CRYUN_Cryun07bG0135600 [Craigia yunnanensis]
MMASSKHLVAVFLVICLLFSYSYAKFHETNPCYGNRFAQLENETTAEGCHFAGTCSTGQDCRQPCAALGRNPDAVKCVVSSPGGNRCCCIDY